MLRLVVWHRALPSAGDDATETDTQSPWTTEVASRLARAGATLLGCMGGTVVATFGADQIIDITALIVELLQDAEGRGLERQTVGVAVGEVTSTSGLGFPWHSGPALDRAQDLAHRGRPWEIVLDPQAQELANARLKWARQLRSGTGVVRGHVIARVREGAEDRFDTSLRPSEAPPVNVSVQPPEASQELEVPVFLPPVVEDTISLDDPISQETPALPELLPASEPPHGSTIDPIDEAVGGWTDRVIVERGVPGLVPASERPAPHDDLSERRDTLVVPTDPPRLIPTTDPPVTFSVSEPPELASATEPPVALTTSHPPELVPATDPPLAFFSASEPPELVPATDPPLALPAQDLREPFPPPLPAASTRRYADDDDDEDSVVPTQIRMFPMPPLPPRPRPAVPLAAPPPLPSRSLGRPAVTTSEELATSEVPRPHPAELLRHAVDAIRADDFDAMDQCIDMALSAHEETAPAHRIRALAKIARGDLSEALRLIGLARPKNGSTEPRTLLAEALVLLHGGQSLRAARLALRSLGHAREAKHSGGEAAALYTLGACFRALDRTDAARRVDETADQVARSMGAG